MIQHEHKLMGLFAGTKGGAHVGVGNDPRDIVVFHETGATICEPNADLYGPNEYDDTVHEITVEEARANAQLHSAALPLLNAALHAVDNMDCSLVAGEANDEENLYCSHCLLADAIKLAMGDHSKEVSE